MILKQKAFQELVQMMKLKENQEKKVSHPGIEPACIAKTQCAWRGTVQRRNLSATKPSISPSVITCTVQVTRISWQRQNKNENICKITKICLLERK